MLVLCQCANAQIDQFLPEIDLNYKLTSVVRLTFQAKETREGGEPTSAELGPSVELYLKPLVRLQDVTLFDLDDAKSRPLVFSIGYRYLPSPDAPTANRIEPTLTSHFPLARFLLTDNRSATLAPGAVAQRDGTRPTFQHRVRCGAAVGRRWRFCPLGAGDVVIDESLFSPLPPCSVSTPRQGQRARPRGA